MYAAYKELHPPTGVDHCLQCHFFDLQHESLVVASTSFLRVYDIKQFQAKNNENQGERGKLKLVEVGEYHLHGNVQSMERVQLAHSSRDTLLLSFSDAKLSLVEWDAETNGLRTVSLHQFEEDELRGGLLHNTHRPIVRVDPDGRAAAVLVFGCHLAVLPFHCESGLDEPPSPHSLPGESSGVLPSYTIDLRKLQQPIVNVKDFCFVHGYNSPTVFILYEPVPTWAGRISLRKDTAAVVALSLSPSEEVHPIIWSIPGMPHDSSYLLPIPKPILGVLMFGGNSLLYLNQSAPPFGVSLNSISDITTRFPLKKQPDLCITMDCSQAVLVAQDQVIVSLQKGDIYLLTMVADGGMRGLKNIQVDKIASSVIPSCMCTISDQFLFIGSRLGNSLLLKYSITARNNTDIKTETQKPIVESAADDLDELEMYGTLSSQSVGSSQPSSYKFEVCDSLVNIGPIADATIGEPAFLSEEFMEKADVDLELVLCSGYGKNGSLSVLQRGIRPQVVTTFELPGCTNMWTVYSDEGQDGGKEDHTFLILSRQDSTMVLQTGQEIAELDSSGFSTQVPTLFAGNLGKGRYIIQATLTDIRLLRGVNKLNYVAMDVGGGVKMCDVCDPYAVVLLVDGRLGLLELKEQQEGDEEETHLELQWPDIEKGAKVVSVSSFTDHSGMFTTSPLALTSRGKKARKWEVPLATPPPIKKRHKLSIDEEDKLLYGDIDELTKTIKQESKSPSPSPVQEEVMETSTADSSDDVPTQWCAVSREDGALELYKLPEFHLVFSVRNFAMAPHQLYDSGPVPLQSPYPAAPGGGGPHSSDHSVEEVLLIGMGPHNLHPHILAIINKELVVYKAFSFPVSPTPGHLQLRFSKVHHRTILHDRREGKIAKHFQKGSSTSISSPNFFIPRLRVFHNIAGYSGVFVCGSYPHWVFMTEHAAMRVHPMFIDGPISSFASFNNVNCPKGFLYFNKEGELRICVLPTHLSYDSYWPVRKVPIKSTPRFVSYHMESRTHALVTCESHRATVLPQSGIDEPDQFEPIERDENFAYPMQDEFFLQLYSPTSWEPVPNARFPMGSFDRVTAMKVMQLRSQETLSGRKEFIVVGTTATYGEDIGTKGRILIFDVIEVNPEPGKPLTKHKLKCLYNQEQKFSVSTLEVVDGLLLSCMGQKIFMWQFKDKKDLVGIGFIDAEVYLHSAKALRGFVLTADVSRSIQLLRYQENRRTLSQISKDPNPMEAYACEYLIDGQQLGFLAADADQNLILYQYQPEDPESNGGLYLVRRGEFNLGAHINVFFRIRCKTSAGLGASRELKIAFADKRHISFFGTLDGGLGYVLAVPEKVYRRLSMLQLKLANGVPHTAGLNPKAFRSYTSQHQFQYNPQRTFLDGRLLWEYLHLSAKEKTDFAKQIGTSPAQILEDLKELDKVTAHF